MGDLKTQPSLRILGLGGGVGTAVCKGKWPENLGQQRKRFVKKKVTESGHLKGNFTDQTVLFRAFWICLSKKRPTWVKSAVSFINMQKIEDFTMLFHLYPFLSQVPAVVQARSSVSHLKLQIKKDNKSFQIHKVTQSRSQDLLEK